MPAGPTHPVFGQVLAAILANSPLSDPENGDISNHSDNDNETDGEVSGKGGTKPIVGNNSTADQAIVLPLALLQDLRRLNSLGSLNCRSFATSVLRCAPTSFVQHLAPLIVLYDEKLPTAKTSESELNMLANQGTKDELFRRLAAAVVHPSSSGNASISDRHEPSLDSRALRELQSITATVGM